MVKLTGPGLSSAASGSLADTITFSKCKGQHYLRKHSKPANPRTAPQTSPRAIMRFLSQAWTALPDPQKASWQPRATTLNVSPYHAFLHANLRRWSQFRAPSQTDPASETGTQPYATFFKCYGGSGCAYIELKIYTLHNGWGFILFRSTAPTFPTGPTNALRLFPITETGTIYYTDPDLTPGTYYYNARHFTTEGLLAAEEGEKSALVT